MLDARRAQKLWIKLGASAVGDDLIGDIDDLGGVGLHPLGLERLDQATELGRLILCQTPTVATAIGDARRGCGSRHHKRLQPLGVVKGDGGFT